jgi:hypothetical protein
MRRSLLSEKQPNRNPTEIVVLPELILQKPLVRILDVLGQIAEKGKRGCLGFDLGDILNFHVLPLQGWRRVMINDGQQQIIQLTR